MTSSDAPTRHAGESLDVYLRNWASGAVGRTKLASVVAALAQAGIALAGLIAQGPLSGSMEAEIGEINADGDKQRKLDVIADRVIMDALRKTSTAYYASEEEDAILTFDPAGDLAVAVDPLDGSSNIDANLAIATIFSIFPASPEGATASFFRKGAEQIAAGYIIYGPHTALLVTLGEGVAHFVLDPISQRFRLISEKVQHLAGDARIRHQRLQLSPLAGADPRLHRRLRRRRRRAARQGFQHALDRLPGRRRPSHFHPRRGLSLSGRPAARLRERPPAPAL